MTGVDAHLKRVQYSTFLDPSELQVNLIMEHLVMDSQTIISEVPQFFVAISAHLMKSLLVYVN